MLEEAKGNHVPGTAASFALDAHLVRVPSFDPFFGLGVYRCEKNMMKQPDVGWVVRREAIMCFQVVKEF